MDVLISREVCVLVLLLFVEFAICIPEYFVEDHCGQTLALNLGAVEAVKLRLVKAKTYPNGARCAMRVQAPPGKRLQLKIEKIGIKGLQEQQCNGGDFVAFFDGPSEQSIPIQGIPQRICRKPSWSDLATSDRFLVILFASNNDMDVGEGMTLVITAFNDGSCNSEQFKCASNSRCIQKQLECDGTPSCPDGSDEGMPKCLTAGAIVGIGIGGVILLIAIIVIIVICVVSYIRRKRARTIRRAIVSENSPNTFWYAAHHMATQREQLHAKTLESISDDDDDCKVENKADCKQKGQLSIKETAKVIGPNGQELDKIPSGFWDIQLSDLYTYGGKTVSSE